MLAVLGLICAALGMFLLEGISIEYVGIILGGLGYYFGLRGGDRGGRMLAILAVLLNIFSMLISGLTAPPQ